MSEQQVGKVKIYPETFQPPLMVTSDGATVAHWCIHCYPKKEPAEFIYRGMSYCEECFKNMIEYERRERE